MDHENTEMSPNQAEFHSAVNAAELLAQQTPEAAPRLTDRRNEIPEIAKYLHPNERVVEQHTVELPLPEERLDSYICIRTLTHNFTKPSDASFSYGEAEGQGKFNALFGRDSVLIAEQIQAFHEEIMPLTLTELAKYQSRKTEPMAEATPGQIPHEIRPEDDKFAIELTKERGWKWPYYGAVDATLLFIKNVSLLANEDPTFLDTKFKRYDAENDEKTDMRTALSEAIEWAMTKQDEGKFGLIEYQRLNPMGIENQILRDSGDSMTDKSGRIANHEQPIASLQVQANAYDAFADTADLYEKMGRTEEAADFRRRARHLHDQVLEKFWIEDERGSFMAVGLDYDAEGKHHALDTRTNDMAFVLNSRLLEGSEDRGRVKELVKTLFSDEMRIGGGLRSLSDKEVQYLPGGYHTGSDWIVGDWVMAKGLERHGFTKLATFKYQWIQDVSKTTGCNPEYVLGSQAIPTINDRIVITSTSPISDLLERNTRMQPPELGQGWTAGANAAAEFALSRPPAASSDPQFEYEVMQLIEADAELQKI